MPTNPGTIRWTLPWGCTTQLVHFWFRVLQRTSQSGIQIITLPCYPSSINNAKLQRAVVLRAKKSRPLPQQTWFRRDLDSMITIDLAPSNNHCRNRIYSSHNSGNWLNCDIRYYEQSCENSISRSCFISSRQERDIEYQRDIISCEKKANTVGFSIF